MSDSKPNYNIQLSTLKMKKRKSVNQINIGIGLKILTLKFMKKIKKNPQIMIKLKMI